MTFMIYGAYGYTGVLVAELAVARGLKPVLAGRDEQKLRPLAERLGLPWKAVGLDDEAALVRALADVQAVLHCAGPFHRTSRPMVRACLAAKRHYLDITGEMSVFESVLKQDARAKEAGVVLMPGVGFDVVPSDCQAAHAKRLLPSADSLELLVRGLGGASHGTTRTAIEGLHMGGAVRRGGVITPEPIGARARMFMVGDKHVEGFSVPWGDVSTAFHSTGIPDVTVYFPAFRALKVWKSSRLVRAIFGLAAVRALATRLLPAGGPTPEQRARGKSQIVAIARDSKAGMERSTLLRTPEGYTLTADAALVCMKHVLAGDVKPGAYTPSSALGADLVLECEGVTREDAPA
jgi:short subunit dehydrogenase-like uncharacterized protein